MRYQVFIIRNLRVGPFWNRRTTTQRLNNRLSTDSRSAALRFAVDYQDYWANDRVIVEDTRGGVWLLIKRGVQA